MIRVSEIFISYSKLLNANTKKDLHFASNSSHKNKLGNARKAIAFWVSDEVAG